MIMRFNVTWEEWVKFLKVDFREFRFVFLVVVHFIQDFLRGFLAGYLLDLPCRFMRELFAAWEIEIRVCRFPCFGESERSKRTAEAETFGDFRHNDEFYIRSIRVVLEECFCSLESTQERWNEDCVNVWKYVHVFRGVLRLQDADWV